MMDKFFERLMFLVLFVGFTSLLVLNVFTYNKVEDLKTANAKSVEFINEVRDSNDSKFNDMNSRMQEQADKMRILQQELDEGKEAVKALKESGIHPNTDIGANSKITTADMNRVIDYYDKHVRGGTPFKNRGEVFIKASRVTGLNPIYLFAHAACESSYGNSYLAKTRKNYFGINAVDSDPGRASHMGDDIEEGIVSGAVWIKQNYYDNGYTTLSSMKNAGYASDPNWARNISSVANTAISVL